MLVSQHGRPTSSACSQPATVPTNLELAVRHQSTAPRRGDLGRRSPHSYREEGAKGAMLGSMQTVYDAAGGADGLMSLASAWHARVMADEVVSHAFSHGYRADHTERLAAYWAEALGGPTTYTGVFGDETAVVRMHSGNGPHEEMDRRAIACFDQALVDVGLDARTRVALSDYFAW